MRLLNTATLQLVDFIRDIPLYAILSHTWGPEEVSLQDLQDPSGKARQMAGFSKIQKSCELARNYHFEYIWIDTCCINKESSAELSEAINSMYPYYRSSRVCYVYMSDFTRGWTLQELLAPSNILFFDQDWNEIGTKSSLADVLTAVTGIPFQILRGDLSVKVSIAARMSWAAKRQTTRSEDIAYCLMGIFSVNMPTLYGEGAQRAFMRLQEEIIKYSDDQSIFAWRMQTRPSASQEFDISDGRSLFASSPAEFIDSGKLSASSNRDVGASPYAMTNLGLHIYLPVISVKPQERICLAILNCNLHGRAVGIYLHRKYPLGLQFSRVKADDVALEHDWVIPTQKQEIYVQHRNAARIFEESPIEGIYNQCALEIRNLPSLQGFAATKTVSQFGAWARRPIMGSAASRLSNKSFDDDVVYLWAGQQVNIQYWHSTTNESFTVVLGRGLDYEAGAGHILWAKVLVDSDIWDQPESWGVTEVGTRRGLTFLNLAERDSQMLKSGEYISVIVHCTGSRNLYVAEISIGPVKQAQAIASIPSELKYSFDVKSLKSYCSTEGFTLDHNASSPGYYHNQDGVLHVPEDGFGVLDVRDDTDTVVFAIALGMYSGAWVEVLLHTELERLAKMMWKSYSPPVHQARCRTSVSVRGYEGTIQVYEVQTLASHATHVLKATLLKNTASSS
ncbi:hypothetical protein D9758_007357 [Tetrapyrgos nigripes]|uniref:Heterokaryon incompatibility domain-containing protein n=1 Tax=Tetrapyrgos nigripes TaxID=182062 RepID=A0A8H5LLH5_9AGAR|nr:hypothetical protein D9758_007357 [Tetrapyrgos nigripes]